LLVELHSLVLVLHLIQDVMQELLIADEQVDELQVLLSRIRLIYLLFDQLLFNVDDAFVPVEDFAQHFDLLKG